MKKANILSIDDDENLQVVIRQYLEDDGYNVLTANNLSTGLEKSSTEGLDVILLDLSLPDGQGMTLIPEIRKENKAGIIVVSGKDDTTEKIVCLEMGADDYLTKPFEMRELTARIKAVMRRLQEKRELEARAGDHAADEQNAAAVSFAGWHLDPKQYQVFDEKGNSADLTTGEFQLLHALVQAPNRALKREYLFDMTRAGKFDVYDRAIDIQIARLRKKLNDNEADGQFIKTIRGVGYMFCPPEDKS